MLKHLVLAEGFADASTDVQAVEMPWNSGIHFRWSTTPELRFGDSPRNATDMADGGKCHPES